MTRTVFPLFFAFVVLIGATGNAGATMPALDWHLDASTISANCTAALSRLSARTQSLARERRTDGAVELEDAAADARDALAAELFLFNVASDANVRNASRLCRLRWRDGIAGILADRNLYAIVAAAPAPRDPIDRALSERWKERMERGGATLSGSRRDEYVRLVRERNDLENRFWTNLADDRTTIRAGRRTIAVDDGSDDFLRTERDEDARKAYERAYNRRAAAANVPLLERTIALRDRLAHLLGFESWADYRLAGNAAGAFAQVQTFLRDAVSAYAQGRPPASMAPWDVERDAARPPSRTIDDALDSVCSALDVRCGRSAAPVWAPGVRAYAVTDASDGRERGMLYVDVMRRPGKAPFESVPAVVLPRSSHEAAAAIVASWKDANDGEIDGDRIRSFLGDAGRAMAIVLASVPYESLAGVSNEARELDAAVVERLAGETPATRASLRDAT
ncbi:MAG: hypothetical protein JO192_07330, partial [Candidatus Eremiobacteraeota bacterium]|nr:hypothetical protein [Candidatus Eremiobacteraeota bacterium]